VTNTPEYKKPRIVPVAWLLIAATAMVFLNFKLPLVELTPGLSGVPIWLLLGPGSILLIWSAHKFAKAGTGVMPFSESTKLITTGIYRFTRNPMYLGMALFLAGGALKLGSLGAWIPVPLFIWVIDHQFIRNEEIFLTGIYGDEYRDYLKKVRRWI